MSDKDSFSRSSAYVQSLVDFILDTKPYHSKLTEIVEEYRFSDSAAVSISERLTVRAKLSGTWSYNYFSSANPLLRTAPLHRVAHPSFFTDRPVAGLDESTDLALVPHAYAKRAYDGDHVSSVHVARAGHSEPMLEGHDYFVSHGSFQFQVKQTLDAQGRLAPLWSSTADDGALAAATAQTRANALDATNPASAVSRARAVVDAMAAAAAAAPQALADELEAVYALLDQPTLPQTYEPLFAAFEAAGLAPDPAWMAELRRLSSPLFFGMFSDLGLRQSGALEYDDVETPELSVRSVAPATDGAYEDWTLEHVGNGSTVRVVGSISGPIGFFEAGSPFESTRISFESEQHAPLAGPWSAELRPANDLVVAAAAPLETWNLIKVNPIAYSRPVLESAAVGRIADASGRLGRVTVLDQALPTGTVVLTARDSGTLFDIHSTAEPSYSGVAAVGSPYDDGRLGFTIVPGSRPFRRGERFFVRVDNEGPRAEDLTLGFGYDMERYDTLGYDGRFADYDTSRVALDVGPGAQDGRWWRAVAVPGQQMTPAEESALGAMPELAPDGITFHWADQFAVEWSDDGFVTSTPAGTVAVGGRFFGGGVSFTVAEASARFVATVADGLPGGDVISFRVINPGPTVDAPVEPTGPGVPHLLMRGDGFAWAPDASWALEFDGPSSYTLTADGQAVATVDMARDGSSFRGAGVHFTVVDRLGLLAAGDRFTFDTSARKAQYLVHGSVSGWQPDARVGERYWNGRIGFLIRPATAVAYVGAQRAERAGTGWYLGPDSTLTVDRLRPDAPSVTYALTAAGGGYMVSRSDVGVVGHLSPGGSYADAVATLSLDGPGAADVRLDVNGLQFPLWNGQDIVVLRPRADGRLPSDGETVVVERSESASVGVSLTQGTVSLSALRPQSIDERLVGLHTGGVPLANTSPDAAVLRGWLPAVATRLDSEYSVAEYSDPAALTSLSSAATGQPIATVRPQGGGPDWPTVIEWAPGFFSQYLPLNAEANVVVRGTGWDDRVRARVSESVKFLTAGGALQEDWLFRDDAAVGFDEATLLGVRSAVDDSMAVTAVDGPFGGFLAGYDNLPYDEHGYDLGTPQDLYSLLQAMPLADAMDLWGNYVVGESLPTTEAEWEAVRAALAADPPAVPGQGFGLPSLGLAVAAGQSASSAASAAVSEAMVAVTADSGTPHDVWAHGVGGLDSAPDRHATLLAGRMPPVPAAASGGYDDVDTPLEVLGGGGARTFEVAFAGTPSQLAAMPTPTITVWASGAASGLRVGVVERSGGGRFRFSLHTSSPVKIAAS